MDITIAIDAMGGDHGPHVTVPACLDALKKDNQLNIVLVGLEDAIQAELKAHKATTSPRLRIHHASQVVLMDESPQSALKNKKSPSKRGMHRSHDFLVNPALAVEPTTGETHLRHHISPTGYYRGRKVVATKAD